MEIPHFGIVKIVKLKIVKDVIIIHNVKPVTMATFLIVYQVLNLDIVVKQITVKDVVLKEMAANVPIVPLAIFYKWMEYIVQRIVQMDNTNNAKNLMKI